ncbi:FecR family protein [Sphingomonas sp. UYP23]
MTDTSLNWEDIVDMAPMEAATLLVEQSRREDRSVQGALLDRWLSASEENRQAWSVVIDVWDAYDGTEESSAFAGMRVAALSARPERRRPAWIPYAAAASLIACFGSVALIKLGRSPSSGGSAVLAQLGDPAATKFGKPDFATGRRQTATYAMPDGSRVTLSPNSAVDVAYADGRRLARLVRGRAAFDVRHDPSSPFQVAVGDRVVSDVGTYFITSLDGSQVSVALVRGSVTVARGSSPEGGSESAAVTLQPGQEFVAGKGDVGRIQPIASSKPRPTMVTFDGERLSDAVARINLYSADKMIVGDPKAGSLRISGTFRINDSATFARTLSQLLPVRIEPPWPPQPPHRVIEPIAASVIRHSRDSCSWEYVANRRT